MPNYLVIYTNGEVTNSCTFDYSDNLNPFTTMLRDLGYKYEVYYWYSDCGYVRTTKYPAD